MAVAINYLPIGNEEPVVSDSSDSADHVIGEPIDSDSLGSGDSVNEELDDFDSLDSGDSALPKEWDGQLIVDINQNRSKGVDKMSYLKTSLLIGLRTMGIKNLSPLQVAIVNSSVRHGPFQNDLYVSSPKGTGKRLGYAMPIVESVTKEDGLQALIVVRDRTSAWKVRSVFLQLTYFMEISAGIAVHFLPCPEELDYIEDDRESSTKKCQVVICTPEALMKSKAGLRELKYLVIDDMEYLLRENQFISRLPTQLKFAKIVTSERNVTDLNNLNGLGLNNPKILLTKPFA